MEIKTCEEYVLAELEAAQAKVDLYYSDHEKLMMLKNIFVVEDGANPGELNIGVKEELLDMNKDPGALARVVLLKDLFDSNGKESFSIEDLIKSGALVKADPEPESGGEDSGAGDSDPEYVQMSIDDLTKDSEEDETHK